MNRRVIGFRNKLAGRMYANVLKPFFFLNDPEYVHDCMVRLGSVLGCSGAGRTITRSLFGYENPTLEQEILGMRFKNPIGLAAGFDKNAELTDIISSVGFGFAEVGSITGKPCEGNPRPRLWRLKKSKSLAVYYGLKNDGCESISYNLRNKSFDVPIGISVAMTNCADNLDIENAIKDYAAAFRTMEPIGSYMTINVSCPNTQGGQPFIDSNNLNRLLDVMDEIPTKKPVFIKLSPDLDESALDSILAVIKNHRVQGIICTNLTKKKDNPKILDPLPGKGGLSGKVVQDLSDKTLSYIYKKEGKRFLLIGCGGVFTAEDAYRKIRLGASLVQMITGMIFEGPQVVSEINLGLTKLLERDGFKNISEAIGVDNRT